MMRRRDPHILVIIESTPKTPKTKKVSFGHLFTFFNPLIPRHHRISKNENLLQNNSFLKIVCFRSGLIIEFVALFFLLPGCDNRHIYEKNTPTETVVTKQVVDTVIITNHAQFNALVLAQKKEYDTYLSPSDAIDSIHQTNYWLKLVNNKQVETPKRLNKTKLRYKNGRLVYSATFQNDGDLSYSHQYYFDYTGLLLAKHKTNSALNLVEEQFKYSKDNMVVAKTYFNGKGKTVGTSKISYDTTSNSNIETIYWLSSETQTKVVKFYDSSGNLTQERLYQALMNKALSDTTEQVLEHQYDKNGLLLNTKQYNTWGMILNHEDALYSTTSFEYDSMGYVIKSVEKKANGELRFENIITYKYDSKNNWVEKVSFKNGLPESKLVRMIYYKKGGR